VWLHNRGGHASFLLGRYSHSGFWYYYPVYSQRENAAGDAGDGLGGFRVRTVAPLARSGNADGVRGGHRVVRSHQPDQYWRAPHSAGVYGLCGDFGVGLARAFESRRRWVAAVGALLLGWQVVESIPIHPDYLAYTNELAGSRPERVLADSDLDWGQDMNRLHDFFAQRDVNEAADVVMNISYGVELGHTLPKEAGDFAGRSGSRLERGSGASAGRPRWMQRIAPTLRIGRGTYLWYVGPAVSAPDPHRLRITTAATTRVVDDAQGLELSGTWATVKDFGQAYLGTLTYSDRPGASDRSGVPG